MSWLISDSSNANSTGHLSTYDSSLYYNQDSWRLCKNIMWVGPESQKWQQSFDLDSFYSTDKDFGFNKKFNGFTFNTSADMPSLSQAQGSLPNDIESYKNISDAVTFSKDFTATQMLYKKVEYAAIKTYTSSDKHISFTANCSGTITAEVDDGHDDDNGDDCYFYILKNGKEADYEDGDSGATIEVDYNEGDTIEFKAVDYKDHSPDSDITSSNPTIEVTWQNRSSENTHISYYNKAYTASADSFSVDVGSSQNNPIIKLWRCLRTVSESGNLTMKYSTNSTTKTYYAAYVGGVLATSFLSETVGDDQTFEVNWSDVDIGSEIIFYYRPYFDGTVPKQYLEDEVDWVMNYCCKNGITSWSTNMYFGGGTNYFATATKTDELGEIVTLSCTQTRTHIGYNLTGATVNVTRLPKINGLPYKGTTIHNPSYSSSTDFICPNERHRKSGHFVVTKDGTVSAKCALQSLIAYNSYDNYQQINPAVTIKKNGNVVASYSNLNETKSYTTDIAVSAGDIITVSVSGIFTQNSYYELDYDDEVVDKCYLTGDKDETGFTVYKDYYDSANTPAYDMAFIVSEPGSLEWSYNDVRNGATSSSSDGILNIFVNGERKVRADNDGTSSSGSISLNIGDVVLIRYCTFGCSVGNKDVYVYVERGWDTPGGQCTISFSGETTPAAFNHTLSWREYCKLILAEARLWVDDNSLTDYALPIAIIDDAINFERTHQFFTELSNSKLYVDLWAHTEILPGLNASYVKCFNADMKSSEITTALFEGKDVTQVRIKDATQGVRAFKNTTKKIDSIELVNISGDWTEAFRNSVSTGVNVGKFTTNGLTSAKDMFRGCEIRYNWSLDEDKLKAFFNDTYNMWVAGDYNFRSAFIGSYHSGTIPEQFMSAEDQFACNWDPAILIQKVASTYDVSRQPLTNYYFASVTAITSAYSNYLEYSKTAHTIKLVSRQYDESTSAAYIYIDNKAVKGWGSRGHFIGVIDCKTMQFKYEGSADTYGTPESADAIWTAAINAAGPNDIIVAVSYDATSVTSSARSSINSCGGDGSTWTSARIAHTFIGKKGLASGEGYEGTASGSNYSTISAKFDEDRGLVHRHWAMEQTFGLSPIYEKDGQDAHFGNYPNIIIPEDNFWKWCSVFAQIKDTYDCALFSITKNNKANFNIDVYTSGDEKQVNYNYDTSFRKAVEANAFDNLILHLRKVENATNKSISIEGMFKDIENLHCVGEIKNIQDITSAFEECSNIIEVSPNLNNVEIADYAFKDCHSLTYAYAFSNSCYTAMHMFENCDNITDFDIKGMTALLDATSMFEGCTAIKTDYFTKATEIPEALQIAKRMFAKCNITEISGNWVPPNSYTSYRNQDENGMGNFEDDWVNETTKEGWSFPEKLYSAYQMFAENPITKISNLKFNPNANNSWIFQDCHDLTIIKYSFLDVDAYDNDKCTGMFDGCSLKKENVIWLPISISSDFDLAQLGLFTDGSAGNEKISYWMVDDHWCEVDHSGFVEYQHIRRPAYLDVYRKNYDKDVIIKFWSHPHIHSAEMRGYNELHDTKVYYDPETLQGGAIINYNEWLKGKQTK